MKLSTAVLILISGFLFLVPAKPSNAGTDSPWGDISVWNGHYPYDHIQSVSGNFFEMPQIHKTISLILTQADRRLLARYTVAGQIETIDGYDVLSLCQPHDCPAENATVILAAGEPSLWIAFYAHIGAVVSVRWYGTDDYEHLPADVLNQVLWGHEPKP
jgi:hypothetical protein